MAKYGLIICLLLNVTFGQRWLESINEDFIQDTLLIKLRPDSVLLNPKDSHYIRDNRLQPDRFVMVRQTMKSKIVEVPDTTFIQKVAKSIKAFGFGYVPVDQYVLTDEPLAREMSHYFLKDSVFFQDTLIIEHTNIWYDKSMLLKKGWVLNGYTRLVGNKNQEKSGWTWEIRIKKKKGKKFNQTIYRGLNEWITQQSHEIKMANYLQPLPFIYKRGFEFRWNQIFLKDGYIFDWRIYLDYPIGHGKPVTRGLSKFGIQYQKTLKYQSIALGAGGEHILKRINQKFLRRIFYGYRIGANNFNPNHFEKVDIENILFLKIQMGLSVEYYPEFHRGIFLGAGIFQGITIWPTIINRFDTGVLMSVGMIFP